MGYRRYRLGFIPTRGFRGHSNSWVTATAGGTAAAKITTTVEGTAIAGGTATARGTATAGSLQQLWAQQQLGHGNSWGHTRIVLPDYYNATMQVWETLYDPATDTLFFFENHIDYDACADLAPTFPTSRTSLV